MHFLSMNEWKEGVNGPFTDIWAVKGRRQAGCLVEAGENAKVMPVL